MRKTNSIIISKLADINLDILSGKTEKNLSAPVCQTAEALKDYLHIISSDMKEDFNFYVKRKITRQWIRANIKYGIKKLKQAQKILKKDNFSEKKLHRCIGVAISSIGSAKRMMEYQKLHSILLTEKLKDHLIAVENIDEGDILLSYKTDAYLKKDILSKLISSVCYSKITHSLMVSRKQDGQLNILSCSPTFKGLKETALKISPGEIIFVMKPKIEEDKKERLLKMIRDVIEYSKNNPAEYKFSETKCWSACFLGLIYSFNISIGAFNVILPNPLQKSKGYFCNEIIENIFRDLKIYLTPRSEHHSVAGPAELFYSPYLEYKGIYDESGDVSLDGELMI